MRLIIDLKKRRNEIIRRNVGQVILMIILDAGLSRKGGGHQGGREDYIKSL